MGKIYLISRPIMVEPYLKIFTKSELKNITLLLHDFTSIGTFLTRYPGAIDVLSEPNIPEFKSGDTVITTVHLNTPTIYNHFMVKLKNNPKINWVHFSHDYMDQRLFFYKEVNRIIAFNRFQYNQLLLEGWKKSKIMQINPHRDIFKQSEYNEGEHYKAITGRDLTTEEQDNNIMLNITSIPQDWIFERQTWVLKHLIRNGYRIFIESYGFDLPKKLEWLEKEKNVYHCGKKADGPCGMPLAQKMVSYVLGIDCSALIEALFYYNLPIFIQNAERFLTVKQSGLFNWYIPNNKIGIPFPMTNMQNFSNVKNKTDLLMKSIEFMKYYWYGETKQAVSKAEIKRFIFGEVR